MNNSQENDLIEKIAQLIDEYLETEVEDLSHIDKMVQIQKQEARKLQEKNNALDAINGGSK
tara:strand:+ start:451 stop:633 length:183 start_codon:yes stop_codon:yes gene_type:complete